MLVLDETVVANSDLQATQCGRLSSGVRSTMPAASTAMVTCAGTVRPRAGRPRADLIDIHPITGCALARAVLWIIGTKK